MGVVTRAKKRRLQEEGLVLDLISGLPDGILGDIISLHPTKDGARTQLLSFRWRYLWRAAPLNVDLYDGDGPLQRYIAGDISRILATHSGPSCRFYITTLTTASSATTASTPPRRPWTRSPALDDNLRELEIPEVAQKLCSINENESFCTEVVQHQ
ncbi:unnamed protein product [Urochloa humidicola]